MRNFEFGTCEFCFPIWGALAMKMAGEAGFTGIEITDGGGYLQSHPLNNGYVEYERFGLDLSRQDSYPLTDKAVQDYYLSAAEKYKMTITAIHLFVLESQGLIKFADHTPQGQGCIETIKNGVLAAYQMGIPAITIPVRGLFGTCQYEYAYQKLRFAVDFARKYGIQVRTVFEADVERQMGVVDALEKRLKLDFHTSDPLTSLSGEAPDMIRKLGLERISQFRVKDLSVDDEGFLTKETSSNSLLGCGYAAFDRCAEAIKEIGYSGWIVSETAYYSADLNPVGGDYTALAAKDVETLKKHFDER